jgi:Na+-transporting methylmalonyl-CoA/oxaloacetate decarboxylase gamma subunit
MLIENWFIPLLQYALEDAGGGSAMGSFNMLRLLRLLRLTRVARLMRYNPELLVMVKGMVRATRAVFYVLIFLVLVMYVCAIVFTSMLISGPDADARRLSEVPAPVEACEEDEDPPASQLFNSIAMSMLSLLTHGVLGDNLAQAATIIMNDSPLLFWLFFLFFIFTALTLYNMLLGILCEVINRTQEEEQELATLNEVKETLMMAFETLDKTHDGLVSEVEWQQIKTDKAVIQAFCRLGIDEDKIDLKLDKMQRLLFGEQLKTAGQHSVMDDDGCNCESDRRSTGEFADKGLTFEDFVEKVFELREDTTATALDLERCKMQAESEERELREHLQRVGVLVERLTSKQGLTEEAERERQSAAKDLHEDEAFLRSLSTEKLLCALRQRGDNIGMKLTNLGATEPLSITA